MIPFIALCYLACVGANVGVLVHTSRFFALHIVVILLILFLLSLLPAHCPLFSPLPPFFQLQDIIPFIFKISFVISSSLPLSSPFWVLRAYTHSLSRSFPSFCFYFFSSFILPFHSRAHSPSFSLSSSSSAPLSSFPLSSPTPPLHFVSFRILLSFSLSLSFSSSRAPTISPSLLTHSVPLQLLHLPVSTIPLSRPRSAPPFPYYISLFQSLNSYPSFHFSPRSLFLFLFSLIFSVSLPYKPIIPLPLLS